MGLFKNSPGTWWFWSESDPRWNTSGHVATLTVTTGMTVEAEAALKRLESLYGDPPDDLEYGCMKD